MNKDELLKRRELLLKKKELLQKKAELEASKQGEPIPERAPHSQLETGVQHAVEGAAMGFGDNLAGGFNKGMSAIKEADPSTMSQISGAVGSVSPVLGAGLEFLKAKLGSGDSPSTVDQKLLQDKATGDLDATDPYTSGVMDRRQLLEETAIDHPTTAALSNAAGGVTTGLLGGGLLKVGAKGATGLLAAEGAAQAVGQGDADIMSEESATNAAIGGTLGVVAPGVVSVAGKILKKVSPEFSGTIYRALKKRVGAKQPEKVKAAIKWLEDRHSLFTKQKGITITPEKVDGALDTLYSNANSKLAILTDKMAKTIRPDKLKGQFRPLLKKLEDMQKKSAGTANSGEIANKLNNSVMAMREAIESGDYKKIIQTIKDDIEPNYISYNNMGEAQVNKTIRGEMKQFAKEFSESNSNIIKSVLGEDSGKLFKNSMDDLSAYHKVKNFVTKNVDQETKSASPNMMEFVTSGYLGYMTNQVVAAAYLGGSTLLRQPAVQGFMAKTYKQVPRSFEATKDLITRSPVGPFLKESLPDEIMHLVPKIEAGIVLPTAQQHLVVKAATSMFPEFYEYSEHESLVDNKITDPYEVETEKAKIKDNASISNLEKYKRIKALNKDGTVLSGISTAKGTVKPLAQDEQQQIGQFLQTAGQQGAGNGSN